MTAWLTPLLILLMGHSFCWAQEQVTLEQMQAMSAEMKKLTYPTGRATPELLEVIKHIDENFRHSMTPEALTHFQQTVAEVGGKMNYPHQLPASNTPFWLRNPHPVLSNYQSQPQLPEHVDLAIIGTGLTGAFAGEEAIEIAKEKGLKIAFFDMNGVSEGASARNGGLFEPIPESFITRYQGLVEEREKRAIENYPKMAWMLRKVLAYTEAFRMIFWGQQNAKIFKSLIAKHKLDVSLSDKGWVRFANSKSDEVGLKKDVARLQSQGIEIEWWSPQRIKQELGKDVLYGARFTKGYGFYHPYDFVTQLFEKMIQKKNVELYTHTRITKIDWSTSPDKPLVIHTERGSFLSDKVIVATDAHTGELIPELKNLFMPYQSVVLAFDHVLNEMKGYAGSERHGDLYYQYPPKGEDKALPGEVNKYGTFVIGGFEDTYVTDLKDLKVIHEAYHAVAEQGAERIQDLHKHPPVSAWTGVFAFSPHRLPFLSYVTHDGVLDHRIVISGATQGYGGWICGILGNTAAKMALLPQYEVKATLDYIDPYRFLELPPVTTGQLAELDKEKIAFKARSILNCKAIFAK